MSQPPPVAVVTGVGPGTGAVTANLTAILGSTDLAVWNELGTLPNALGAAVFTDAEAKNSSQKFYRARPAP